MNKNLFSLVLLFSLNVYAQVGINTSTPKKTLHVNGSLQLVKELNVGGDGSTVGSAGKPGQVLMSNGPDAAPKWADPVKAPEHATGTVIMVDGKFKVAQEIIVQLSNDFIAPATPTKISIGNLNNVIIDNEDKYTGDAQSNSFKVVEDGVYQVTMNCQLSTKKGTKPVIGIWDETDNKWVARVNDEFTAGDNSLQTYTLITSIKMLASHTYSFSISHNEVVTVKHLSQGSTGEGPITQMSLKRLK